MRLAETIDGGAVRLRGFREDDAEDLRAGCDDPVTARFLPGIPSPYTLADARWWIEEGAPAQGNQYAITDPDTDRLIGGAGIAAVNTWNGQATIGYWVAPAARSKGVATAATRALADAAFAAGLVRLNLSTAVENVASQRVAIAAGFTREAVRRGAARRRDGSRQDMIGWARLADDPPGPSARLLPDLAELTDGVVTLRPVRPDDLDDVYALMTLPEVIASSAGTVAFTRETIAAHIAAKPSRWLAGERADLAVVDAASGAFAGEIGLYYFEPWAQQAMIGYSLVPAWRGRGYATRAAKLVSRWAFEQVGIARLIAGTNPGNAASQRVLERAGFVREGLQRSRFTGPDGTRVDDVLWALLPPSA